MHTAARLLFRKNLVLVRLLLLLMLMALPLGLLQTPALATTWQVYYCDPNTGPSLVDATLMDSGNYGELRGDNGPAWYFVDSETSPNDVGYGAFTSSEGKTIPPRPCHRWVVTRFGAKRAKKSAICDVFESRTPSVAKAVRQRRR